MTDLREVLAFNIKLYRKNLGLSQEKLAEKLDIAANYIALIETGKRFPSINMLERIATALQKDTVEMFSITPIELSRRKSLKTAILADIEQVLTVRFNEDN